MLILLMIQPYFMGTNRLKKQQNTKTLLLRTFQSHSAQKFLYIILQIQSAFLSFVLFLI